LARRRLTIVRRVGDQPSIGPIGVRVQSVVQIKAPVSLPPARKLAGISFEFIYNPRVRYCSIQAEAVRWPAPAPVVFLAL
jgi:hypothetical protein